MKFGMKHTKNMRQSESNHMQEAEGVNTKGPAWKHKAGYILLTGAVALGGAAILTTAYLTDQENVVNEFTVGKVDIDLDEPSWEPEEHTKIQPTEKIKKDPQITNVGENDAFVYLEISVPMGDVIVANEDGTRQEQKKQVLFTFDANEKWSLMESKEEEDNMVYTYCYTEILEPSATTTPIFETVTFANVIEGQLDSQKVDMPVNAYAIQTMNTGGDGDSIVSQAKNAYVKYKNQNK